MFYQIFLLIVGLFLLIKGADFIVSGATSIAKRFHLSEILIGIVIVGIGTSLPEIIVTVESTLKGNQDIILGNSIGSCICNLLLVLGIACVFKTIKIDTKLLQIHLPVSAITIMLLIAFCNFGNPSNTITRSEGIVLLIIALIYIGYTIYEGKEEAENDINTENIGLFRVLIYLVLGILGLKFGADFVVSGAVSIAEFFNLSESIISITIVSIGTSLPEIITAITASVRNESDLVIGNVIGSNIFNICLLPAIGAIISPIKYDFEFNKSIIFLLIVTLYLLVFDLFRNKRELGRKHGIVFILLFSLYIACLF